jgi:lipoprotein NlpI
VFAHWVRGRAELYGGRPAAAADDFEALVRLRPEMPWSVLWLHIARMREGKDDAAELETNAAKIDRTRWPWPIFAFYLDSQTPEELMAAAEVGATEQVKVQSCQAEFYIGVELSVRGDPKGARRSFQSASAACPGGDEGVAAMMELKRLDALGL